MKDCETTSYRKRAQTKGTGPYKHSLPAFESIQYGPVPFVCARCCRINNQTIIGDSPDSQGGRPCPMMAMPLFLFERDVESRSRTGVMSRIASGSDR